MHWFLAISSGGRSVRFNHYLYWRGGRPAGGAATASASADDRRPAMGAVFLAEEIDAVLAEAVPDTVAFARLIAKVMTFVADELEAAVSSSRTSAANDPVEAPALAAPDKPAH